MEINEAIKVIRKQKKWTQKDLAKFLGKSVSLIQKWENGTRVPDQQVLWFLRLALITEAPDDACLSPDRFQNWIASLLTSPT